MKKALEISRTKLLAIIAAIVITLCMAIPTSEVFAAELPADTSEITPIK